MNPLHHHPTRQFALLLLAFALLSTGCFGKGGGGATVAAPAPAGVSTGNIVAGSVATTKAPDGSVTVRWKTASPSADGHVLSGTLFFENRPLYADALKEKAAAPTTDHTVVIPAVNARTAFAVTDGNSNLDDNAGRGYVVE